MAKESFIHLFEWSPRVHADPFHTHDHLEIGYCLSGSGMFYFGDKTYAVEPGDVFVVNHLERHAAVSRADNPSRYLFLYFSAGLLEQTDPELLVPFVYLPTKFQNRIPGERTAAQQIGELFHLIAEEHQRQPRGYLGMMKGYILQICALLLRYYTAEAPSADWNHTLMSYYRIKPVLEFIQERFREPISLDDIASQLALSPSRVRHLFQEKLGIGFKQYVLQMRVNEAKKLLAGSDLPISEIMYASGFQSHGPFYRAFGQIVGMAPMDYRERAAKLALFENISLENKTTRQNLPGKM